MSEGALAGQWVLESNAGPTGGVIDELAPLAELSGGPLEGALAGRGFVVDERTDEPLTVLTGNPCFGAVGWARRSPRRSSACVARTLARTSRPRR